jgi:hypothetical protein
MNDEPEKVFLRIRRTITWDREQIIAEIMKIREYLKYWKKNEILNIFFETS